LLSKKTYYALKALICLGKAKTSIQNPMLIRHIIEKTDLPQKFTEAILVDLKQAGIINSKMGKGGGYYLAKPTNQIIIGTVIRIFEGPLALVSCVSKMAYEDCSHCKNKNACSIRIIFQEIRDKTAELLDSTTLKSMLDQEETLESLKGLHYDI
jgi:Rrf2 family protein